jgi:hypothetical protein
MLRVAMERELLRIGNGARGLVYVRFPNGTGHMFNVEVIRGVVEYWDDQGRVNGLQNFFRLGIPATQQRVRFYRTGGPDHLQ